MTSFTRIHKHTHLHTHTRIHTNTTVVERVVCSSGIVAVLGWVPFGMAHVRQWVGWAEWVWFGWRRAGWQCSTVSQCATERRAPSLPYLICWCNDNAHTQHMRTYICWIRHALLVVPKTHNAHTCTRTHKKQRRVQFMHWHMCAQLRAQLHLA